VISVDDFCEQISKEETTKITVPAASATSPLPTPKLATGHYHKPIII
jgi:hypothetical protein